MPVIKSAIKAMKQANAAKLRNQAVKADFRGKVKAVKKEIVSGGKDIDTLVSKAIQAIDKAAKRGVIHKNAADRRKSRLMLAVNQVQKTPIVAKSIKEATATKKAVKPKTEKPVKEETKKPTAKKTTTTKSTKKASK